jgi:serine phosphatase RsbU (regulator of sigma subunit)/PAS domain-containing protein/anti-sigma regulatory factor (Ser/Thr protein kinase)
MDECADAMGAPGFGLPKPAIVVLDRQGRIIEWSAEAEELAGRPFDEVEGRLITDLLVAVPEEPAGSPAAGSRTTLAGSGGHDVDVFAWAAGPGRHGHRHVLLVPREQALEWGHGRSFLRAFLGQDSVGVVLHDNDLRVVWTNITPSMFGGPPVSPGDHLRGYTNAEDAVAAEALLRQVLDSGVPVVGQESTVRSNEPGGRAWTMSLTVIRMEDTQGEPAGVLVTVTDVTEPSRLRRHRDLLHRSAGELGTSLDIVRTARALADILTPELANIVTVDLAKPILSGDEPPSVFDSDLVRIAVASTDGPWPDGILAVGGSYPVLPQAPSLTELQRGGSHRLSRSEVVQSLGEYAPLFVPPNAHSLAVAQLRARGRLFGSVTAWRTTQPEPYDDAETELLAEIGSRAALAIDNARRYTREHRTAETLQQRLLPRATTDTPAAQTVALYRPAGGRPGISGDWFDAITLPSLQVALVVGDVIGHGLIASATMGRLRTAIQTFADLELDPADVLTHVDDLVHRLAAEAPESVRDAVGATCFYAVYDPIACRLTLASAGQPPPILITPDGKAELLDISPGPPLGVGGFPYESTTLDITPGSVLALYTDGILGLAPYEGDDGLRRLQDELAARIGPAVPLAQVGLAVLGSNDEAVARDDVTLMLSRLRRVPTGQVATWEFPPDLEAVAEARANVGRQLSVWHLDDLAFTTELVVSELVTNAIRHAGGPVGLRLIRDRSLICEVTDPSNTQPRLVRATDTDEGGRGLFIVAQCTNRWGCRYRQSGKTIWTEQLLFDPEDPLAAKLTPL